MSKESNDGIIFLAISRTLVNCARVKLWRIELCEKKQSETWTLTLVAWLDLDRNRDAILGTC